MAEFEELRLTVNLVDNASAGLQRIRAEIGQLTQSAGQMVTSFNQAAAGITNVGTAATRASPALRSAAMDMRQLEQHARSMGGGLRDMATAVTLSSGGLTQLGIGLVSAVGGLRSAASAAGEIAGPNIRMATLALGTLAVGFTAVGAAAGIAGLMIFKFAKETDQLSRTAKTLGLSFADLKSAGEQVTRFGGSMSDVVQAAAGMQKAMADLAQNGSQLRSELMGKGLDPNWLRAYEAETEFWKKSNMGRREALLIEKELIEKRGMSKMAARGIVAPMMQSLGLDPNSLDRPELKAPDPRWKMIEDKSRDVMKIWREIDEKIMGINFTVMGFGLERVAGVFKEFNDILGWVDAKTKSIKDMWTTAESWIPQWLKDFLTKPAPTMDRTGPRIPSFDEVLRGMMNGPGGGVPGGGGNPIRDAPHQKLTGLYGANDNGLYQPASFGGGGGSNVDNQLQSIIKGGVFEALVEYAAFARVGGVGGGAGGGGTGGFTNASFGGTAGAAGGGGFKSGGGYNVLGQGNVGPPGGTPGVGAARGKVGAGGDPRGMEGYIRQKAAELGIDPDTAVAVAKSEGLSTFQSSVVNKNGEREKSFGAFQLFTGGGLGNDFQKDTGLDPSDPANEKATIDYALAHAAKKGWGAFHGAKNTGIGNWAGIGGKGGGGEGGAAPFGSAGGGAEANQSDRPHKIGGKVTLGGKTFDWGSGGSGRGSIPYGSYPVNIGKGDIGGIGQRIGSVATVGGASGTINDPKYPGQPRVGIQIHPSSGATLDDLYTQGCFGVPRAQWPAFKATLLEEAAKHPGGLSLTIGRNGKASIDPRAAKEVAAGSNVPALNQNQSAPGDENKRLDELDQWEKDYTAHKKAGGTLDTMKPVAGNDNWSAIDKATEVNATGKLSVDVKAPPGTKVEASGGGLFKDTELQRSTQMPVTESGPRASNAAPPF